MMRHQRSFLVLVGLLPLFASPSAADTPTNTVVSKHIAYASFLASRSIRYMPEALDAIRKVAVEGEECEIDQQLASKLGTDAAAQVKAYIDELCRPWQAWLETFSSHCDSEPAPKDCAEEDPNNIIVREFERYVQGMAKALTTATGPIMRFNILSITVEGLDGHLVTEFPEKRVLGWLTPPISEFLKTAEPTDVIFVERQLKAGWIGLPTPLADLFRAYASRLPAQNEHAKMIRSLTGTRFDE
jgi:hypothetical protein